MTADGSTSDLLKLQLQTRSASLCDHRVQFDEGSYDSIVIDIPVRNHAHQIRSGILCPNTFLMQRVAQFNGIHSSSAAVKNDDVGTHASRIDL